MSVKKNNNDKIDNKGQVELKEEKEQESKLKDTKQARDWCFTINNPVQNESEFCEYLKSLNHLRYCVFQPEAGDNTGTKHYQGYIEFTQPKRFTMVKKLFSENAIGVNAHIEYRRGKRSQAREYCMAEETRLGDKYYEVGRYIEIGERTDLIDIMQDVESGMTLYDLSQKHGERYIRHRDWAKEYRQSYLENKYKNCFRKLKVVYIYGKTGCGKTSYIYGKHGYDNVYRVLNYNFGWIDDYNAEDVIVFEEFRNSFYISEMLNYLDGHPLRIRGRNYNRVACYSTVYILSNRPLYDQYKYLQTEEPSAWEAFLRRITEVYNFDISKGSPMTVKEALKKPMELRRLTEEEERELNNIFNFK